MEEFMQMVESKSLQKVGLLVRVTSEQAPPTVRYTDKVVTAAVCYTWVNRNNRIFRVKLSDV